MKCRRQVLAVSLLLCAPLAISAQDDNEKPSRDAIQLQLEFHSQKAKLLKTRMELMKSLEEAELEQIKLEIKSIELKREMLGGDIQQAEADLEAKKADAERMKRLFEKNVLTEQEFENSKLEVVRAESALRNLRVETEQHKQETASAELSLKRRQLEGAIQLSEVQLEVLEAEFHVKELKLALQAMP